MALKKTFGRKFEKAPVAEGEHLFPIMSLMIILIPFLVGNIAFMQIKTLEVSTPGQSQSNDEDVKKTKNVISQLFISKDNLKVNLVNEDTGDIIKTYDFKNNKEGMGFVKRSLEAIRAEHKKFDTMLVTVESGLKYKEVMLVLDNCKLGDENKKKLVEAGKTTSEPQLNIIILPQGMES